MARLVLSGVGALALYVAFFSIPFYLPHYVSIPILPGVLFYFLQSPPAEYAGPSLPLFSLALAGLGCLYVAGLLPWLRSETVKAPPLRVIIGFSMLFCIALSLSYPVMSNDLFKYAFEGKIWALYRQNPFLTTPSVFPQDPFLPLIAWRDELSAYGPLWKWMEAAAALPDPNSALITICALKAWVIAFFLADSGMIYLILRRRSPRLAAVGVMIFAWNPLLLVESAANGHNDTAVVFFVLLAVYFLERDRFLWVMPALLLSALVKPVPLLLAPVFALYILRRVRNWREGLWLVLRSGGLSVVVVLAAFYPFWEGWDTLSGLARQNFVTGSPGALAELVLRWSGVSESEAHSIVLAVVISAYGLLYLAELVGVARRSDSDVMVSGFYMLFWYLCLASIWFLPWYLFWPMAFVALLPPTSALVRLGVLFTVLALVAYPVQEFDFLGVPLIFGPVIYSACKHRAFLFQIRKASSPTGHLPLKA